MKFFDFWYQKFLLRFSFMIAFVAFLGIFLYASWTETKLITLSDEAPFQQTFGAAMQASDNEISLSTPHRTDVELKNWINKVVAETLSFNSRNIEEKLSSVQQYYSVAGFESLKSYIKTARIVPTLLKDNSAVGVFVREPPLLMNSQSVSEVHRWLYQMPIMISFIPEGQSNLLGAQAQKTQNLVLRLQIRRTSLQDSLDELQIESWKIATR